MGSVGDYQSAIQLVAGANLAFYTFPELRQPSLPKLEQEEASWNRLLGTAKAHQAEREAVLAGTAAVMAIRQNVATGLVVVRRLCLGLAALYVVLLLWTCHAASQPTDGRLLEAASVIIGFVPAAAVLYFNLRTTSRIRDAARRRRHLERLMLRVLE